MSSEARTITRIFRAPMVLSACLGILLAPGCTAVPDYGEYRALGEGRVGYSEQPLAPNRYRVTVSATSEVVPVNVENNLLRRAAELTLRQGYTHFMIGGEDVQRRTYYFPIGDTYLHGPDYGRRAGLWPEYPNVPEIHTRASAEVLMLRPDEAAGNPQAIPAQSVL